MRRDLDLLTVFLAVAKADNFRAAADRLGITRSAVSQSIRRLEDRLSATLVTRTTRAVRLTEAGAQLFADLSRPMSEIAAALDEVGGTDRPRGHLRLAVTSIAEQFLSGPLLATFAAQHPHISIDVTVTDAEFDIVAAGYDAGVRLGEIIEQDMIAVPITSFEREMVAAAPSYLAAFGTPTHPRELLAHRCIGWRPAPDLAPYRWEFEEDGAPFDIAVHPQITTNDLRLMLQTAAAGGGITFVTEATGRDYVASGALVPILEAYLPPFPGFFLYFPQRRNMAPKLRALVAHIRANHPRPDSSTPGSSV